jgi:hypothetical protein
MNRRTISSDESRRAFTKALLWPGLMDTSPPNRSLDVESAWAETDS